MSSPPSITPTIEDEDTSAVSTPVLSNMPPSPNSSSFSNRDASSSSQGSSEASPTLLSPGQDSNSSHLRLPIPTPSANRSQSSFAFADVNGDDTSGDFDDLPPEVASADISIAPDGSFVETSSATAARELKKRYDRHLGVGKDIRSPYAITAFVNQHGKQMFRVGHRDQDAPAAASTAELEQRTTLLLDQQAQQKQQQQSFDKASESVRSDSHKKRRSRMSIHAFMGPATMFPASTRSGDFGPSPPRLFSTETPRSPPRKLRKSRSNPQLSPSSMRPPARRGDIFSDVMQWTAAGPSTFPTGANSHSTRSLHMPPDEDDLPSSPAIIAHPFGPGVVFDSPFRRSGPSLAPPQQLREMQSFESVLTARAEPSLALRHRSSILSPITPIIPTASQSRDSYPPASPDLEQSPTPSRHSSYIPRPEVPDPSYLTTPETSNHTRYSTEVFDVLQAYSGLPLLDRISPDSTETTVIKMSANADDTASPRDDPRFVIWAEIAPEVPDDVSISQSSHTGPSSSSRSRRSNKGRESVSGIELPRPVVRVSAADHPTKALVAATIERWIAQLTSELNYDELLVFFLTYRTYIGAVDLCYLLICRFHWALGQPVSEHDEMVRRIVRVRTFVAIRYWLLTFFAVDFIPNRELRLLLASWLNTLRRDPILKKHPDATSIVTKLHSVVRECKEVHTRQDRFTTSTDRRTTSTNGAHLAPDASKQKEAFRQSTASAASDLDLDFVVDGSAELANGGFERAVNPQLSGGAEGSGGRTAISIALMQQPLHQTILQHRPSPSTSVNSAIAQTPATLPVHHNALSRAFVSTIGRLGRWKRVLQSRSSMATPAGAYADVSAFDLELNATGDLLTVRGGVEQYLKMIDMHAPPAASQSPSLVPTPEAKVPPLSQPLERTPELPEDSSPPPSGEPIHYNDTQSLASVPETPSESEVTDSPIPPPYTTESPIPVSLLPSSSPRPPSSISSSGSSSYGVPLSPKPESTSLRRTNGGRLWRPDVVDIDDLDLSDTSSDGSGPAAPPGLKKPTRRLPLRRDFEFVEHRDSVSSMGLTSRDSLMSGQSSTVSSAGGGLGSTIQQWHLNALVDSLSDDEEAGDVEDALKRLEGDMNPQKQRAKESKVDHWVKTIRDRMDQGDYGHEEPRFSADISDDTGARNTDISGMSGTQSLGWYQSSENGESRPSSQQSRPSSISRSSILADGPTPIPTGPSSAVSSIADAKPSLEDVVPLEIIQSRVSSSPSLSPTSSQTSPPPMSPPLSKFVLPQQLPKMHRSFVHGHGAAVLAQHFSIIDRELFLCVKFEELTSDEWRTSVEDANILDWGLFLKERARWKAEGRRGYKTSALVAARGRFNLVANFVLSEVVLTHPAERPALVGKFIRIAWKCYTLSNFSTLVAIIAGLRSEWVTNVMRKLWSRVNVYNVRMLNDLTQFVESRDDFGHIRSAVETMANWKQASGNRSEEAASSRGSTTKSKGGSESKPQKPPTCVPFLGAFIPRVLSDQILHFPHVGIYLSQLYRFSQLPDLIDPTAPNEAVGIDTATGNFGAPAHPEVFETLAPLPPAMQLEPLINVQKQRLIAGTIKSLVAGQHLASRVQHPIDRKLFQKCLKLRGLDHATLTRAAAMYS
ncbi:hypothetical protein EWM64_g5480 [Hericium alpestre]|uniref:Ras-GEF domain-containing protein n=1 Tax=Hericium alpestre TaxID=135208 RepID=A0A4Y9ZWY1_9AGAM|nr:hypothetical protein EWM64_g5480 [Hericium alpestre]